MNKFLKSIKQLPATIKLYVANASPQRVWRTLLYTSSVCLGLVSVTALVVYGVVVTSERVKSEVAQQTSFDTKLLRAGIEQLTSEEREFGRIIEEGGGL